MNILVIGMGSIGKKHLNVFKSLGCTVDSFDPMEANATFNYEQELDLGSYDAFIISSPSESHLYYVKKLIGFNKPVLVEKPLVTTERDLEEISNLKNIEKVVSTCNLLFHWPLLRLKDLISNGVLGKLYSADFYFGHDLNQQRKSLNSYAFDVSQGGCWLDVSSHELAVIHKLIPGKYQGLSYSLGENRYAFKDEVAKAVFKVDDKVLISLSMDLLSKVRRRGCVVVGEKGVFEWQEVGKPSQVSVRVHYSNDFFDTLYPVGSKSMFENQAESFLRFCKNEIENFYPLKDVISTTEEIFKHKRNVVTYESGI
jgi:predicted dehydrogenase